MTEVENLTNQIYLGMVQSFKSAVTLKITMVGSVVTTESDTALSLGMKFVVGQCR